MCGPPPLGRHKIQLAPLRGPTVTGAELPKVRAEVTPGSATVVRPTQAKFHTHVGTTQSVDGRDKILQFAVTHNREARMSALPTGASFQQAHVPGRDDALKWTERKITRLQYEEDDKHMDHLRRAMARIPGAKLKWPEDSTA